MQKIFIIMSNRKRVNISLDPATYEKLRRIQQRHRFKNLCELMVALATLLVDRMQAAEARSIDMPEDDARYIDLMFDGLAHTEPTPDGTVPVRHNNHTPR